MSLPDHPDRHEFAYLPVDLLVPNTWNVQEEDELTFQRLVDEIKPDSTGFVETVSVIPMEDGTYRILHGEHRWRAAKAADLEEVPCLILKGEKWRDEDLQKFVSVRLNVIRGKTDPEKFLKLYNEMVAKYGAEALRGLMGYTDQKAFSKLVDGVKRGMKKSMSKEMSEEFNERAREAKSIEDLQKILQTLFTKHGDTLQYSFMVFTHGKQQHLYINTDRKMWRAMGKVTEYCKATSTDINLFMGPIINECMREATKRLSAERKENELPDRLLDEPENGVSQDPQSGTLPE